MIEYISGLIKIRRGITDERLAVILELGELAFDTEEKELYIGDGITPGGIPISHRLELIDSFLRDLATVATTGSYDDLTDKPSSLVTSINEKTGDVLLDKKDVGLGNVDNTSDSKKPLSDAMQSALSEKASLADLATVATSGNYNDLEDKPSIPAEQIPSDWDAISGPSRILNKPSLSNVATSGDYEDLSNKPVIPVVPVQSVNGEVGNVTLDKSDIGLSNVDNTSDVNKPVSIAMQDALNLKVDNNSLATVATSGSYVDLSDKPFIPAAQVPSDWDAIEGVSRILNKPTTLDGYGIIDAVNKSEKGAHNGVATLGPDGRLLPSQVPPLAITEPHVVNNEVEQLALIVQIGDVAIRTDISKTFINITGVNSSMDDWVELLSPPNDIISVNGKVGVVVLNKTDIGLGNVDNTSDMDKPVSTAIQNALNIKVDSSDLSSVAFSGSYSDLSDKPVFPNVPVQSVNNKTGDVVLDKGDIGLGKVDNTSDTDKPISMATQDALNLKANVIDLATVATSGSYDDLSDKPFIPAAQVPSDWNASVGVSSILNKPTTLSGFGIMDAINVSEKGINNGVATLGPDGKLPVSQIPPLAITEPHVVNNEEEQLALIVQIGDVAVRTDLSKTFINATGVNSSMDDWVEMLSPPNSVVSVNGKTGAVVINKNDIGLGDVDNTSDMDKPISDAVMTALNLKVNILDLATVALSGNYNDLSNKPDIQGLPHGGTEGQIITVGSDGAEWSAVDIADRRTFLGYNAQADVDGTVIGHMAQGQYGGVVLGSRSLTGELGVSLGFYAISGHESISIGNDSYSDIDSVAIGLSAYAGYAATALGKYSNSDMNGIAIGVHTTSSQNSLVIGNHSDAMSGSISIGGQSFAGGFFSLALGPSAQTTADYSLVIGPPLQSSLMSIACFATASYRATLGYRELEVGHPAESSEQETALLLRSGKGTQYRISPTDFGNLRVDTETIPFSEGFGRMVVLTQAEYDSITPHTQTLYFIKD